MTGPGGPLQTLKNLLRPGEDDPPEVLEKLADLIGRSVERLRQHAGVVRFLRGPAQDQIVAVGEAFELVGEFSVVSGIVAERIRFYLDDEPVAEIAVNAQGAFHVARCERPGLHTVRFEVLGPGDIVVQRGGSTRVHVVDESPVVLLDVELVLADLLAAAACVALPTSGLQIGYLDFSETPRNEAIAAAIVERGLPPGPILAYGHDALEPALRGGDFRATFVRTTARRLRASGVGLAGIVTVDVHRFAECRDDDIFVMSPRELEMHLPDASWIATLSHAAAELHRRRDQTDRFAFRLDEATRTRSIDGNRCHVELDNRRAREAIFATIEEARQSIVVQVYIVEDGDFMDRLSAHLVHAARRGVRVRMLVDALYSRERALGLRNPILAALHQEPGIDVRATDPVPVADLFELQSLKRRDHRKLFVVDSDVAFVSGRNFGNLYYTSFDEVAIHDATPYERIPWLDAHIEVRGPLVEQVSVSFEQAWMETGGERGAPMPKPGRAGDARARLVVHHGVHDMSGMAAYEAILDAAEDHVFIVNDFPIVSTLVSAVRRAMGRGVSVVLLTGNGLPRRGDGTFFRGPTYRELFEHMTKGRIEPLVRRGLALYEYATPSDLPMVVCAGGVVRPYVHAKLMTADGRVVSVGSANLDATASFWERETNVVVEDEATTDQVETWIREALSRSLRIDPDSEYWQRESRVRDVVARLWPESFYS